MVDRENKETRKSLQDFYPLVSVIIPSYNHIQYVKKSIQSVIKQTYSNIELIVIDDGSSDGSAELLTNLSKELEFKLILQSNSGICATLNRAIRDFSSGQFIALLASDDIWAEEKIELQVNSLRKNKDSAFCFSQAILFSEESNISNGRVFPKNVLEGNVLNKVFIRQHVPANTMLFSRELFNILDGFDESLKEEDWDFVIRSAAITKFIAVAKPLLFYRSHDYNIMKTRSRKEIFQQKIQLLSKNSSLVPSYIWFLSVLIHFMNDIVLNSLKTLFNYRHN